jgi:hypothetical protein
MTDGRASVKACPSRSMAVVSKMPKRTSQRNYKCSSKQSCVSILREERGELPERAPIIVLGKALRENPIDSGSGPSAMAPGGAFLQFSPPLCNPTCLVSGFDQTTAAIQFVSLLPVLRLCLPAAKSTRWCFAICFPPYRFNRLRVDAKGHLSAPVKPSEHLLLFQVP